MKVRFGRTDQQRGLMTVLAATGVAVPLAGKMLTEDRCSHCAFDRTALDAMIAAAESVLVVSCSPEGARDPRNAGSGHVGGARQ